MKNSKNYCIGSIELRCDDFCTTLVIDKYLFDNMRQTDNTFKDEISYNICMQDSTLVKNNNFFIRLKNAFKYLFRKQKLCYNDIYIEDLDKFNNFINNLVELSKKVK